MTLPVTCPVNRVWEITPKEMSRKSRVRMDLGMGAGRRIGNKFADKGSEKPGIPIWNTLIMCLNRKEE
jgi:hypothetical protein